MIRVLLREKEERTGTACVMCRRVPRDQSASEANNSVASTPLSRRPLERSSFGALDSSPTEGVTELRKPGRWRRRPRNASANCIVASPSALLCPSGEKPLDVVQDQLVVIGLREDRAVLTKLTRSMGCALRGASKDNVQLRPH